MSIEAWTHDQWRLPVHVLPALPLDIDPWRDPGARPRGHGGLTLGLDERKLVWGAAADGF